MCAAPSRIVAVFLLVVLTLISPVLPAAAQNADAELMAQVMVQRENEMPLAGPLSGAMVQSAESASISQSGVQVGDFTAHVAFTNPSDGAPWDFGFDFGGGNQIGQLLVVDSSAEWTYFPYPEGEPQAGPAPGLSPQPGARNSLDILVQGTRGVLYVSGMYVGSFQLPQPVMGDVSVATGSFAETAVEGRTMPFTDFTVWALPNTSGLPQPQTIASTTDQAPIQQQPAQQAVSLDQGQAIPGAVPGQSQPPDDRAVFAAFQQMQQSVVPLAGPYAEVLTEDPADITPYVAGVMVDDFHASADFIVPATGGEDVPWDIGFIFGDLEIGGVRVVVDSGGNWTTAVGSAAPANGGPVMNLAMQPGAINTLDLFVMSGTAVLGVNGEFAARIPLPTLPGRGDVGVGSAFYGDQTLPGRLTEFQNFTVRPFVIPTTPMVGQQQPAAEVPVQGAPQTQPVVQAPTQGASQVSGQGSSVTEAELQEQFTILLQTVDAQPPQEGPNSSQLVETGNGSPTRLAGPMTPDARNFAAMVTFINPVETTRPWTAGLAFRSQEQVVLTSTGQVLSVHQGAEPTVLGQAMNFDPTPGARNTLQVFVLDNQLLIGVNGVPAAAGSLTDLSSGMGVSLIAGVFPQDQIPNRAIPFEDYRVWYGGEEAAETGRG